MGLSEKPLVNFVGFQLYWWACILLENNASIICLILLSAHLYFHSKPKQETCFMIVLAGLGLIVDSILTLLGIYQFNNVQTLQLPPLWLVFLWLGFATNISLLSKFKYAVQWRLLALAGGLLAPLSYIAAGKLGAVAFPNGYAITWTILFAVWFVLLPALFFVCYYLSEPQYDSQT